MIGHICDVSQEFIFVPGMILSLDEMIIQFWEIKRKIEEEQQKKLESESSMIRAV